MLPGKSIDVTTILSVLRRRLWLIIVPPVVGLFLSLVYSASLPNIYQSDILIAIVAQRVPDALVKSTVTIKTDERLNAIETQVTSRTPLEQMILELDLYPELRKQVPMEDVVARMRSDIDMQVERQRVGARGLESPHAFHVLFKYPNAKLSATVTQRLGNSFVEQNARDRTNVAEQTNQFLDNQLTEARTRLIEQENRLKAFQQLHGKELPTQMQSNMAAINTAQMQIQAIVEATARNRDRRLFNERIYNELAAEPPAAVAPPPTSGTPETPVVAVSATQQLATARAVLQQLQLKYLPEHPDVIKVVRQIADLEPRAAAEAAAAAASGAAPVLPALSPIEISRRDRMRALRAENESIDRQVAFGESEEKRLRDVVAEYQRRIEAVPGVESEWTALTRDYETQMAAYKELLTKSEQSKVALNLERRQIGEQFRILETAGVPVTPISPNRLQVSGIGFAAGLILGLGIALLLELKDTSFRTEADIVDVLAVPVLAMVPYVPTALEKRAHFRKVMFAGALALVAIVGAGYVFWSLRLWIYIA